MGESCLYMPLAKDGKPYRALSEYRKTLGRETGGRAFLKALSPSFQERNKEVLEVDLQGVATLESSMKTSDMQNFVGFEKTAEVLGKQYGFNAVANTADNYRRLLNEAKNFNDSNEDYITYPEVSGDTIKNVVHRKDQASVKAFNDRYGSMILNDRLLQIFEPLGLTVGDLTSAENGYLGIVDFSNARQVAGQFTDLIRVANNMQGQMVLSEEFAHLIVKMLKDEPLMQRVIESLVKNAGRMQQILGNDYTLYLEKASDENGIVDYEYIAEECVGRMLQGSMLDNMTSSAQEDSYFQKLWNRLVQLIKNVFRQYDANEIQQAVLNADQTMDYYAKNLLKGSIQFTREDIEKTRSDERLYHLEENMDNINEIISDAIANETKKTIIIKNAKAVERANKKLESLKAIVESTPEGKLKGLINYAKAAFTDLGIAREALLKSAPGDRNFQMLRGVWSTVLSYDRFIDQLRDLINSEDEELQKLVNETSIEDKNHVLVTINTAYGELARLRDLVKGRYQEIALDSIEEFFKPFFNVEGTFTDGSGRERTLRQLIQEADRDIGFIDAYFMTMSNSGDRLLQLFDDVVAKAKGEARDSTIEDLHEILRVMLDAKGRGITSFEWMFEHTKDGKKTGNYISEVNTGQFEEDKKAFFKALDEKYGKNATGEMARQKVEEKKRWISTYSEFFGMKPNTGVYHNSEFDRLTADQKEILRQFMELKQKYDGRYPSKKVTATRAIQMRRTSQQRLLDTLSNPMSAYDNIKEFIAKELTKSSDDDAIYGQKTGLRSFDGSEFKVLPVLYTTRLSNPEELSTDVFSTLAAYAYSTNLYEKMEEVVDPLEVAKTWVSDKNNRKFKEWSGNKELVEKMKGITKPIYKSGNSNSIDKLENFLDSQVYQRYYADSDKTLNVMGRELKAGKLVNKWLSTSSAFQLGFNALSQAANLATGLGMQNIEAFCGQYFNAKQLLLADKEYGAQLMHYIPEIESSNPKSKLALFDQMFDIKQEFAGNVKQQMNTIFEKVFGKTVAYFGQTCGDHWLYHRTAIAMCLKKQVRLKDGTVTSLWEALKVENVYEGNDQIKELTIDAVDAETGEVIDKEYIRKYARKINEINHRLFGVYNTDDMVAAQRVALGRCILQYRQWIVPLFARRFQKRRYVSALGEYEEGYYITVLNLMTGLKGGLEGLKKVWNEFDEGQKRNCYRALTEFTQYLILVAIANYVDFGNDDPDRSQALKYAEYMAQRELHELGNLTPSLTMGNEILKTVKSPASILNTTQAALDLVGSVLDPRDWFDTIESGKYEGMSTLHKHFLKAPFPILAPFNQIDRVIDNIEDTTRYYARPY